MSEQLVIDSFKKVGSGRAVYDVKTNQGSFYYFPSEYVTKGVTDGKYAYYDPQLLENDVLKAGTGINLDPSVYKDTKLEKLYKNPGSGVLIPKDAYDMSKGVKYYDPKKRPAIAGMTTIDGQNVYLLEGYTDRNQEYFTAEKNTKGNYIGRAMVRTVTPGKNKFGKLGKIASGIAKTFAGIPLLPEIAAAVIPGAGPALYGSFKGLQTAGKGGDLGDVIKSGVIAGGTAALPGVLKDTLPNAVTTIPGAVPAIAGTTSGLLSGKNLEDSLKTGVASGVGSAVAGEVTGAVSPTVGADVGKAVGTVAGGTTAGLLGGESATESVIASTIGAGTNLAATTAADVVNKNLFSNTPQTGAGTMDDFSNGGIQLFDDGSSIFFDNSGNVVGGIDNTGSQFNAPGFDLQIFDDGTFLAKDGQGRFSFSTTDAPLFTGNAIVGSIGTGLSTTAPDTLKGVLGKVASSATSAGTKSVLSKILGSVAGGINTALGTDISESLIGDIFKGLLDRGIDYATAEKIAKDLRTEAKTIQDTLKTAGEEAAVPFTPYTVTSGVGTSTVGPTGATTTLAPEYGDIRTSAIGKAGEALNAIDPAQASETLFGQLEGLAAPARQREQEQLLSSLGAKGLLGIGRNLPTVGGGVAGVNPYVESLLSAQGTQQAQNALAATQFGTSEAMRLQGLSSSLLGMGTGLDAFGLDQLKTTSELGRVPLEVEQRNKDKLLDSIIQGLRISTPLSTTAANVQAGQTGLISDTSRDILKEIFG